jgi:hypothetical protein
MFTESQPVNYLSLRNRRRRTFKQRRSQDHLVDWPTAEGREPRPTLPPLPVNYETPAETYDSYEVKTVRPSSCRSLQGQRHLSKSLGANLQQQCRQWEFNVELDNRARCLSAGDLLGKSHEQLLLLLIQLKRNQSQLSHGIDQLRVQMESEQKLAMLDPMQVQQHHLIGEQLHRRLMNAQKQFAEQTPIIEMIENAIRVDYQQRQAGESKSEQNLKVVETANDNDRPKYPNYSPINETTCSSPTKNTYSNSTGGSLTPRRLRKVGARTSSTATSLEGLRQHRQQVESELEHARSRLDEPNGRSATDTRKSSIDHESARSNPNSNTLHQSLQFELDSIEKAIQGLTAKKQQLMQNLKHNDVKASDLIVKEDATEGQLEANKSLTIGESLPVGNAIKGGAPCGSSSNADAVDSRGTGATSGAEPINDDLLGSEFDDLRTDNLSEMEDDLSRLTLYENEFVQTLKTEHEQSQRLKAESAAKLVQVEVKVIDRPEVVVASTSNGHDLQSSVELPINRKSTGSYRTRLNCSDQDLRLESNRDWRIGHDRQASKGELLGNRISQLLFDSGIGIYDQLQHHHVSKRSNNEAEMLRNQTLLDTQSKLQSKKRRKTRKDRVSGSNEPIEEDVYTGLYFIRE